MLIEGIGERLKKIRVIAGFTQLELASKLQISHQSISKWEREESLPEITMIIQLSDIFSVTTDYILLGKASVKDESEIDKSNTVSIDELTHEEIHLIFLTGQIGNLNIYKVRRLQELGYVTKSEKIDWSIEGKQHSDNYWYKCCELILKEIENTNNIENIYIEVNKVIDVPKKVFLKFVDDLVSIGKINQISSFLNF